MKNRFSLAMLVATTTALSSLLISPVSADYYDDSYTDSAKVIKVKPIYETIEVNEPETDCWNERVYHPKHSRHNRNYGGMITGGIIGGLAGHQVGRGHGKDVATVVGTILGAAIGDNIVHDSYRPRHHHRHGHIERRCETIDNYTSRKELVGYRVKYRYKGHTYWTRTDEHPGDYIQVQVDVQPLE